MRREADRLAAALVGEVLEEVTFGQPRLARFGPLLTGARVTAVTTRGKALLTHFDGDRTMYSHNQLYGRWIVCRRGRPPATRRSLRVALHTRTHSALLYSASEIEVLDAVLLGEHPFLSRLGPDALDPELTWRLLAVRLSSPGFANRSVASLYLDQGFLAGIGNYLRSEILHDARVHPQTRPRALGRGGLGALARSTLDVTRQAYERAGVTNRPGRVRRLEALGYRKRDYRFAVFDREDLPCYRCQTAVRRVEAGGRRLYFCERCQPTAPAILGATA